METPTQSESYQVYPSFQGYTGSAADQCAAPQVYLLPPSFTAGEPISFQLRLLFVGTEGQLGTTCGNSAFSLKFSGPGKPFEASKVLAEVKIGAAAWACSPAARAALRVDYVNFLQEVESLEGTVAIAGSAGRIRSAIADRLPAPLAETLFFRHGLTPDAPSAPYVDLVPGMRLRIDAELSQFTSPSSPNNMYLPAGTLFAEVGTSASGPGGERMLDFEPFLNAIRAPAVQARAQTPTLAGGLVDLAPVGARRSHWRLFVPRAFVAPQEAGRLTVEGSFALVGAESLSALEAVTAAYPKPPAADQLLTYVICGGRALIVPEVPIWLTARGLTTIEHVPLGTTLANLGERFAALPLDPARASAELHLTRPTTAREEGSAELQIVTGPSGRVPPELFDLPVIAGDSITVSPKGW